MKILITNDDGIQADGINILFKELRKYHKVILLAPDREQSASSHSLTLSRPLRMHKHAPNYYSCDGTPTDSVLMAVLKILDHEKPDMVVSGINHGANMGEDIMYSGTVAAAVEGAQLGIPSIAVSMVDCTGANFMAGARFVRRFIKLYPKLNISPSTILNINLPGKVRGGFKKYEFTRLGTRQYDDIIVANTDPRGLEYYWIAGSPIWENIRGSDIFAIRSGAVSITPIHMHFTDSDVLENLLAQNFKLPR
jgi:5'-nucleotidase